MTDESYSFSTARTRLEDIVAQVRKKDTSLEKSLDLLEEGVRLANACTELIDHQDWVSTTAAGAEASEAADEAGQSAEEAGQTAEVASARVAASGEVAQGAESVVGAVVADDAADAGETVVFDAAAVESDFAEMTVTDSEVATDDFADADDAWADESESAAASPSDDPAAIEG